jgi:hypothetical protein
MVNRTRAGWLFVLWGPRPGALKAQSARRGRFGHSGDHLGLLPDAVKPGIHRGITSLRAGSGVSWRPTGSGAHEP